MKLRNALSIFVLSSFATGAMAQSTEQEQKKIVLVTPEFNVSTEDFDYYVKNNIPEVQRDRTLAREGAVREVYENLYVIKAFAARGEQNAVVDPDEIEWMTNHYRERLLMSRQLELEIVEELANADWEAAALEEYTANREKYATQEQVSAAHILISTEERGEEEAQSIGQEILDRLEAGEAFSDLATAYSDDGSVEDNAGELGFFGRGRMVGPFEEAVFAMTEPGEISELVKTQFGYHIIRFNERRPASERAFDEVKDSIIPDIKRRREQQLRADKIAAVKSGAVDLGLEVNVELLQELEARYAAPEAATRD